MRRKGRGVGREGRVDGNFIMEYVPETQLKLRDAGNQMKLALANWNDEDIFRSCVNSFISHARSVTFVMQKESSGSPELLAWYEARMAELKKLPIMKFFHEQRTHIIHRGVVRPVSHTIPVREMTVEGKKITGGTVTAWAFSDAHEYIPGSNGNVGKLCEQYFLILKDLVHDWKWYRAYFELPEKERQKVLRELEQLRAQNRHLEAQVLNMSGVLQKAQKTIQLFNDVLNRHGDSSQNEWSQHVSLEIDRILNPDYFANAPAVPPKDSRNNG
jgi:hypothetical protein